MRRLISVLGTAAYQPTRYHLTSDPSRTHATRYAPVATALLAGPVTDAVFLLTERARHLHWDACQAELAACGVPARGVTVPDVRSEDEAWDVLDGALESGGGAAEILFDVTYSWRHLSFVLFASLTYLTALRQGHRLAGVYYGAWEARDGDRTPIFDLEPLVRLTDWYHAVRTLRESGHAGHLGRLVREARKRVVGARPTAKALSGLQCALERLAWTVPSGLPLESGLAARGGLDRLTLVPRDPPPSRLLGTVRDELESVLKDLATGPEARDKAAIRLDEPELARELHLAERYLAWGQPDRALLLLREWIVSRCLLASGVTDARWLDRDRREDQTRAINGIALRLKAHLPVTEAEKALGSLWQEVADTRNRIAHAGFVPHDVKDPACKVQDMIARCREHLPSNQAWDTRPAAARTRLLVTPFGLSPGVLYTALVHVRPERVAVITSGPASERIREACVRAGWSGQREPSVEIASDPFLCFGEARAIAGRLRPVLAESDEVIVNVTGGTSALQYVVERVAEAAQRLGLPIRRVALIDRRSPEDQRRDPYVRGECLWLDEHAAAGGED